MMILSLGGVTQMGDEPAFLTGHEVILRPILVIAHDYLGFQPGVVLVLLVKSKSFRFSVTLPGVVSTAVITPL